QDRIGIGTFQPKDEKNQDSTELTGDINYRKIAEYGSDSDPRCVASPTLIATAEGLRAIGTLLAVESMPDTFTPRCVAVSSINAAGVAVADSVYNAGEHELRTVETRLGYRLISTPNHMLLSLTPEGAPVWKEVRLLEVGDYVALGRGVHTWSEYDFAFPKWEPTFYGNERHKPRFPERMTPDLAHFLGLWIGDGHYYVKEEKHQYELGWTKKDPERQEMFLRLLDHLFGLQGRLADRGDHAGTVLVGCRNLVKWLQEVIGLQGGAVNKAIPEFILRSSRECVRACL